jgi:hypothetical protein
MSSQDIREALEAHARFDDTAALARLGSVQHRVRVVRRRRRAALAGAAAAVVATVGGLATLLPGDGEVAPADRTFGDLTAPATMTSLGNTFAFVRGVSGEGRVEIDDLPSDEPVLVTWADAGTGAVTVDEPMSEGPWTSTLRDFTDFVLVEPGLDQPVVVTGEGKLVVAAYELSALAEGVNADGRYGFPERVAEQELIAGAIASPGETETTVEFTMPEGHLVARELCAGAPEGYVWRWSFEAREHHMSSSCPAGESVLRQDQVSFPDGIEVDGRKVRPGETVTARIWLAESFEAPDDAPPVEAPVDGVRMGLAFYEDHAPDSADQVATTRVHEGRTWVLQDFGVVTRPGGRLDQPVTVEDGPKLVVAVVHLDATGTIVWSRDGEEQSGTQIDLPDQTGDHVMPLEVLHDGTATYGISIRGSRDSRPEIGFATYVLAEDTDEVQVAEQRE